MNWHPAGLQRVDPLGNDVADDHVMAELGEAGPGDEAHIARSEDGDAAHVCCDFALALPFAFFAGSRGCRPLAIAIIVSFDSESSSVLTTQ